MHGKIKEFEKNWKIMEKSWNFVKWFVCLTACCLATGDKFLLLFQNACLVHNRACTCNSQIHVALKMYAIFACEKYSFICKMSNHISFEWNVKAMLNHLNYQILKQGESYKTGFQVGPTIHTFFVLFFPTFSKKCLNILTFSQCHLCNEIFKKNSPIAWLARISQWLNFFFWKWPLNFSLWSFQLKRSVCSWMILPLLSCLFLYIIFNLMTHCYELLVWKSPTIPTFYIG